jgi:hypothetical protein
MWHHHGGCVDVKLKTDWSIRQAASDPATLALPFSFYYVLGSLSSFSILFERINMILEGCGCLSLL